MASTAKKSAYNFIFGVIGEAIAIACAIVVQRFFILSFGSEVNGFINSINQVFVYVALLEAGVGTSTLQSLYKPVATDDKDQINAVLAACNYFYKRTGLFYAIIIIAIAFIYPAVINSSLNYFLMVGIILLTGLGGALPYTFQSKYLILLKAEGKTYVDTNWASFHAVFLSGGKIVLLLLGANVLVVQGVYLLLAIMKSVFYEIYIRRHYKWVNVKVKPDFTATEQKNSILIHQISSLIFNNTDVLLLTFFCDLKAVSIYTLYKYLLNIISTFITTSTNSVVFKLGQEYHNKERFIRMFNVYEIVHTTLTFSLCMTACYFMSPFLKLYTKGMDINYIVPFMAILMVSVEILFYGRSPTNYVINFAKHFKKTRIRAVAESVINLGSSVILVQFFGIRGVVMGTIIALLYRTTDIIVYANKRILGRPVWKTFKTWLVNIIFGVLTYGLYRILPIKTDNYVHLVISAGVLCIIVFPLQFGTQFLINKQEREDLIELLKTLWNNRKKKKISSDGTNE